MNDYCQELVALRDKDRYLSALFAPAGVRPHLFALYAFDSEITRIPSLVSEPQLGLIRQQWWLDTLEAVYTGGTPDHPVAGPLAAAIEKGGLPQRSLENLVRAHEFDLYDDPMPTLDDLEGYLGETSSAIIQMACLILGESAAEAAGLAGVALGITRVLRKREPKYVPRDQVNLAMHARKRLGEARALIPSIPKAALPAFLPASLTELYLKKLEQNIFEVSQLRRQFTMWRASRRNRF